MKNWITLTGVLCTAVLCAAADEKIAKPVDLSKLPPAATKQGLTYEKDIKSIFDKSCIKCHGEEKQKGKFRLNSLEAALKGGEDGKMIVAGKSAKSPLLGSIARLDPDTSMPPEGKGDPLTRDQVSLIRGWIDQGAK